ncbi:MAG: hypothetical protein LBB83_04175 [Treponema sp.]|jgi:hypothetical protein|nr:hypothetical protein [Treponema sp.]
MKSICIRNAFKADFFKPNASGKPVMAFGAFSVLLACILALSGCGRAKAQGKYDAAAERKQNNAGTLSVTLPAEVLKTERKNNADTLPMILPVDVSEIEQKNGAAAGGETVGADGGPIHKLTAVSPVKPQGVIEIREKMFIAQTNDVYLNPEDYMGRTLKLEGLFKTQAGYEDRPPYCFVLRYGPGCCGYDGNAGFEVAWDGDAPPYPAEDDWVEAVGVLKSYEEDGYPYLYLALSRLQVLDQRGEEFVTQ